MKNRILKINELYFGIGNEYLECPYTEKYFKEKWINDVKDFIQKTEKSNFGDHWILSSKDLKITHDGKNINELNIYELKQLFSEYLDVQTYYEGSNKPIVFLNNNSNIYLRIK